MWQSFNYALLILRISCKVLINNRITHNILHIYIESGVVTLLKHCPMAMRLSEHG